MKKVKKRVIAGGLALASSVLSGCFGPIETVYGPPPDTTYKPDINIAEEVYGPPPDPDFDESENLPEPVYGPELDYEDYDAEPSPSPSPDLTEMLPASVYGPPMDGG